MVSEDVPAPPSLLERARLHIVRLRLEDFDDLRRAAASALRVSARTLGVARVGIWSLGADGATLRRVLVRFSDGEGVDAPDGADVLPDDLELPLEGWPAYRAALLSRRVVAAEDARADPRTAELGPTYLAPHGVGAMLDVPLFVGGEVWGVVCHEHVGGARAWSAREVDFAVSVADMLTALLEQSLRLAAETEFRHAERDAARVREAEIVARTAAGIGHDVNTVLQAIALNAELAVRAGSDRDRRAAAEAIVADCRRGARIVDQLREAETARVVVGAVDPGFVVEDTRATLEALLGTSQRLAIEVEHGAQVPATRTDVERILLNLVVNARDAMPGGGLVRVRVARGTEGEVTLSVEDEGVGLDPDPEAVARLFEPYVTTKGDRNTGLGLFAVRAIAVRTGARVEARGAPGRGATFHVTWRAR